MIGIVNYGMGNIRSVANAVYELGFDPVLIERPDDFEQTTHLILPGVGHFSTAMANLTRLELLAPLMKAVTQERKPMLGICLGMQLLLDYSEEGDCNGLGLISGRVSRLKDPNFRVPHVGWDDLNNWRPHPVFHEIPHKADFYFVHSYAALAVPDYSLAKCDYGHNFDAIIGRENIIGMQFHPEKSQKNGLLLLENFCNWDGLC